MDFIQKIGELAKQTAAKANEALEIGKLNGKIRTEKQRIQELKLQLGELLWNQYNEGNEVSAEAQELCGGVKECLNAIDALNDAIDAVKAATAEAAQANASASACSCACGADECQPNEKLCAACGEKMPKPSRFCSHCGAMQED